MTIISRFYSTRLCLGFSRIVIARAFSKERAGKSIKPGVALVIDENPHKVMRINHGKRGKGGGFVR
jgi:hypothetical protein